MEPDPYSIKSRYKTNRDHALDSDPFHVQFQIDCLPIPSHFVTRNAEIKEIECSLLPTHGHSGRRLHVLYGLGGIGKTQLALAYARAHQLTYSAVLWLNGDNKETLLQSFASFAKVAKIKGQSAMAAINTSYIPDKEADTQAVIRWLTLENNKNWLMIFDNVDREYQEQMYDPQAYKISCFLPPTDHGSVLITTRLSSLGETGKSTKIPVMTPWQAMELLSNRSGIPQSMKGVVNYSCLILARMHS